MLFPSIFNSFKYYPINVCLLCTLFTLVVNQMNETEINRVQPVITCVCMIQITTG